MKIYFSVSICGGRENEQIYNNLLKLLLTKGQVLNKHVGNLNLKYEEQGLTNIQIYNRCKNWMEECDIVIAEVSTPSLGVGYELAYLEKLQKPIFCFYKTDSPKQISPMIEGNEYFKILKYSNFKEIQEVIKKIFNK